MLARRSAPIAASGGTRLAMAAPTARTLPFARVARIVARVFDLFWGTDFMAEADLDVVIRRLAKEQHKALQAAAKARRAHFEGLAAKAKDAAGKARFKALGQEAMAQGEAAAKRLQVAADNAADSYARAMRRAADAPAPVASNGAAKGKAKVAVQANDKASDKAAAKVADTAAKPAKAGKAPKAKARKSAAPSNGKQQAAKAPTTKAPAAKANAKATGKAPAKA